MGEFRVRRGVKSYKKTKVEHWTTEQMCLYFQDEFKKKYGVETRRPMGQLKIHINQRTIAQLHRLEGRHGEINVNELFKMYINWLLDRKTVKNFRVWYFSKQEIMVDFLDERAKDIADKSMGSLEAFMKQEEEKIRRAKEFYGF